MKKTADVKSPKQVRLTEAAERGDLAGVEAALAAGAEPTPSSDAYWHALHLCAGKGRLECAQALLKAGADARRATCSGATPLHMAARMGHRDMVELLLSSGADPSALDAEGLSPMSAALRAGKARCAQCLAEHGARVEGLGGILARTGPWERLDEGSMAGLLEAFAWALSASAPVGSIVVDGEPLLIAMCGAGSPASFFQKALDIGADPSARSSDGSQALHLLADGGEGLRDERAEIAAMLLAAGAQVDALDGSGRTPLVALGLSDRFDGHGSMAIMAELLAEGADPRAADASGSGVASRLARLDADRRKHGDDWAAEVAGLGCEAEEGWEGLFEAAAGSPLALASRARLAAAGA